MLNIGIDDLSSKIDNHLFEINTATQRKWLSTPKKPYAIVHNEYVGYLSTDNFSKYHMAFFTVLLLEIFGVLVLAFGAGFGVVGAIGGAVLIAVDIVFAIAISTSNAKLCYLKNKIKLFITNNLISTSIRKEENRKKWLSICVYFIALAKIAFMVQGYGEINPVNITMAVFFIVIAFLHTKFTDFYISSFPFTSAAGKDETNNGPDNNVYPPVQIYTDNKLHKVDGIGVAKHKLIPTDEMVNVLVHGSQQPQQRYVSNFIQCGLLTDNDISLLCSTQPTPNQKQDLVLELLNLQLTIIPEGIPQNITNTRPYIPNFIQNND